MSTTTINLNVTKDEAWEIAQALLVARDAALRDANRNNRPKAKAAYAKRAEQLESLRDAVVYCINAS